MKLNIQRIKEFIEALSKIDKKKINEPQKELLDFVSKHGLENEGLMLLLKNKLVYKGLDDFSNIRDLLNEIKRSKDSKPKDIAEGGSSKPGVSINPKKDGGFGSDPVQDIGLDWD